MSSYRPVGRYPFAPGMTRDLDPSSFTHGGIYPGQFGYVGEHRAHRELGRGDETQSSTGRHEYMAKEGERDLLGRVTVDVLLHRHCGWPLATLAESATGGLVGPLYMRHLSGDRYDRAAD